MKKRLKKKKTSCKRKIRVLENIRKAQNDTIKFLDEQIERQHGIIRKLGSKDGYEFLDVPGKKTIETEEIRPEQYGNYALMVDELDDEILDQCKEKLVESLVKGLMDNNVVQFIERNSRPDPLSMYSTVAAKINVIPWYLLVKERK